MAVDFTKPIAMADRAQNLTDTKDTMAALAKMLDGLTPTGVANGMIRWNTSANRFEKYNGSWGALSSAYAINVTTFNGQAASYYTNITARLGYTPLDKAGGTMTGALTLNADAANALHAVPKQQLDAGLATKAALSHSHAWADITSKGLTEGANTQDPNTTQSHVILTNHANGPDGGTGYWHVTTTFYSTLTGNRAQIAVQYASGAKVYARSYYGGTWQPWVRCDLGDAAGSFGTNGYAKLPGGLIVQWGTSGSITYYATSNITFPLSFPNACLSAVANITNSTLSSTTGGSLAVTARTASYFTVRNMHDSSSSAQWIAVGY